MSISEWYHQNTYSRIEYEDESYSKEEDRTIVFFPYDGLTTIYLTKHIETIDELVDEMIRAQKLDLSLEIQPNPSDLETFWTFNNWNATASNELYSITGHWFNGLSVCEEHRYYIDKELFDQVVICFPTSQIECTQAFKEMLTGLKALQMHHRRILKLDTLL